jgi:Protein of unknown function (DUF3592)
LRAGRLRDGIWHHPVLRAGPMLLSGTAHRAEHATPAGAFVELTIKQSGIEHESREPFVQSTEISRDIVVHPFLLRTREGGEVLVRTDNSIDLIDRLEPAQPIGPALRTRTARVTEGERLWIKGTLRSEFSHAMDGPYRGADTRWVFEAPPSGRLMVSSQPVGADLRRIALWYVGGAFALIGLMFFYQLVVFGEFRDLRARGVVAQSIITNREEWHPRTKHGREDHYYWVVDYDTARGKHREKDEVNALAYKEHEVGDTVPVTYLPDDPSVLQIGPASEIGASIISVWGTAVIALLLFFIIAWRRKVSRKLKWTRRETLIERTSGKLT